MAIQGLDAFLSDIGSPIDSDLFNQIKTYHIDAAFFDFMFRFDFRFLIQFSYFSVFELKDFSFLLSSLQNRLYILLYIFSPFR